MEGDSSQYLAPPEKMGRAKRIDGVHDRYIEFAKRTLDKTIRLDGLRVVVDCANGAAYRVAPQALWELGAEVVAMSNDPDGFNINKDCGSTAPNAMCEKVREMRADIGIALDGDADRVIIADEKGVLVDGDQILAVIADSWHKAGKLTNDGIVATIMSNFGLERYLSGLGLKLIRTPVGDRYVVERMRRDGFNVGGEQSGHVVLSDFTTTGDGLITALQILSVVVTLQKPVSEVCKRFTPLPQHIRNVRHNGGSPLEDATVKEMIEKNRLRLGNNGRLVIRLSGTEPVVRVMAEADDESLVHAVVDDIAGALKKAALAEAH